MSPQMGAPKCPFDGTTMEPSSGDPSVYFCPKGLDCEGAKEPYALQWCPKCGEQVHARYCLQPTPEKACWNVWKGEGQHLHFPCPCTYEWLEACLEDLPDVTDEVSKDGS